VTPTITPTPAPYPYLLEIAAYNEAGEKVRTIGTSPVSGVIRDITTFVNGAPSTMLIPSGGQGISFDFANMTSPDQPSAGQVIFTWNGMSDSGQQVPPGIYYVKITDVDTYGHVNTKVIEVQVMTPQQMTMISIYNSAGELIQRIQQPPITPGMVKLSVDDTYSIGNTGELVPISYSPGHIYNWDGKNAQGEIVGSGVYEIQVQAFFMNSASVTVSKSISIFNASTNSLISNQKAYPNPFVMATADSNPDAVIAWQTGATGSMNIRIYNTAGELVKVISTALEAGSAVWDVSSAQGTPAASGLYIIVLEAKSNSGAMQMKKIKFAVIKQARDDNVIN
jgi:flagellar hook assembly protein FlgD